MWSEPVTFGGGMTMQYGAAVEVSSAWKRFCSSQARYQRASTPSGSYPCLPCAPASGGPAGCGAMGSCGAVITDSKNETGTPARQGAASPG